MLSELEPPVMAQFAAGGQGSSILRSGSCSVPRYLLCTRRCFLSTLGLEDFSSAVIAMAVATG